jgi:hypothetical protein
MSGIAAVSGSMSSISAASFASSGAAAASTAGGAGTAETAGAGAGSGSEGVAAFDPWGVGGASGSSTSVQTSALINSAQPNANIQNMAALMLSLLLSKSDDSKDNKDDAWKMLAGMAMLGMMAQNQGASFMQSTSVVTEAYSAGGAGAAAAGAAGTAVNFQG